jgi:ribonucleoside-diphosphate reductase beta chain
MLMNFPRFNKMKGMGQIVTWSVRDESLHCEGMIRSSTPSRRDGRADQEVKNDIIECCRTVVGWKTPSSTSPSKWARCRA